MAVNAQKIQSRHTPLTWGEGRFWQARTWARCWVEGDEKDQRGGPESQPSSAPCSSSLRNQVWFIKRAVHIGCSHGGCTKSPSRTTEHMLQGTRRVAVRAFVVHWGSHSKCTMYLQSSNPRLAQDLRNLLLSAFSFSHVHLISSGRGFHYHGLNAQSPKSGLSPSSNLSVEVFPKLHSLTKSYIASKTAFNTPKQTKHQLSTNQ